MKGTRPSNEGFRRKVEHSAFRVGTQVRALGPKGKGSRFGLLHVIDSVSHVTGKRPQDMRVLEIGSGSGRLAEELRKKEGIKPSNYVMGDLTYRTRDAPALKRKIFSRVKKGKMQARQMDIFRKPGNIGKFDIIAVPFVLGTPKYLNAMLENYFEKLSPGGIMVVGSAHYSGNQLAALTEKVARNPFMTIEQLSEEEREAFALASKLHELQEKGEIERYTNSGVFFKEHAADHPSRTFIIQRKPITH